MTTPTDPALLTIAEARRLLAARALSAVELTTAVLDRIAALNPALNAYLRTDPDAALAQARDADRRAAGGGDDPPLLGIPVCVKDVVDVLGTDTTAGSAGWRRTPTRDAGAARRLRDAGAILLANGNTNEFAYGIDGLNPHRGDCRNPYDPARMSGGSSSGPAVATATGMALGGLGTDTTGSIRVPASLCGLAGIRPTLGLVSRAGVVPLAWSYDAVGPLARTVEDVAVLLGAIAGHDPDDPTSAMTMSRRIAEDYRPGPDPDVRGLRLGLVEELVDLADAAVARGVAAAADHLASLGAEVVPLRVGLLRHAPAIHRVVQHAESAQVHAPWFDAQRDRYAPPVRLRLEAGRLIPATAYLAAQQARRLLVEDVARAMRGVDAMLAPSAAVAAPRRDAAAVTVRGRRVPVRDALLGCVLPISQLGCAAASVPVGDDGGLPFGMQVVGRPFAEALVLRIAAACERRRPWADHRPPG